MRPSLSFALAILTTSSLALADDSALTALLPKLAVTSARFEAMFKKASFTITGHMENVNGDNSVSDKKDGVAKIKNDGKSPPKMEVVQYYEDGKDKTADARKKAEERAKEPPKPKKPDEEVHMPFLESVQGKYTYRVGEADAADPARVRVYFNAKQPAENLFNGSAWVDTRTGEVLTMGVAPSKTPMFVDYLRVQLEFGEKTTEGPAISKMSFEGGGGFLFVRKRFRGSVLLSGYDVR